MKTFSAMSVPDKRVTLQAYQQLNFLYQSLAKSESQIYCPPKAKQKLQMNIERLNQLMIVLEEELSGE